MEPSLVAANNLVTCFFLKSIYSDVIINPSSDLLNQWCLKRHELVGQLLLHRRSSQVDLVESGAKGFHKGHKLEKMGLKAQVGQPPSSCERTHRSTLWSRSLIFALPPPKDTAELFFEDVRLPSEALLGEANKGFYYLMNELPQVTCLLCACKKEGKHTTGGCWVLLG